MLTNAETLQLIDLLIKASPRDQLAGRYDVIVTPTIYSPEDFVPRKKVCIGDVTNVVGEINCEAVMDAQALTGHPIVL